MPVQIVRNDITRMPVDAIVNAANRKLIGGSGVNGAIHKAAGPELLAECLTLGGCKTGEAKITGGYGLPCRYVIHTVGPVWHGGGFGEKNLLRSCYRASLDLAKQHGCTSIAFPLISSGVFGYPKDKALKVAMDTISAWLFQDDSDPGMMVYLTVFTDSALQVSKKLFPDIQEFIDNNYVARHAEPQRIQHQRIRELEMMEDRCLSAPMPRESRAYVPRPRSLEDWLKKRDAGFAETLVALIEKSGKKNSEIYKKANVDKKLFSKIVNNINYHPSKNTALAFAIALELNLEETRDLIARAGYSLTRSSLQDIIVEYFILTRHYDIIDINMALFDHDQTLLGGG